MAAYHGVLTLNGSAQSLLGVIPNIGSIKFLSLHAAGANSGLIYVGGAGTDDPTSSDYGFRIEIPVSSVPAAPNILEFPIGSVSLADIKVIGTNNDKLHVFAITP
jgi:hypothetical protein